MNRKRFGIFLALLLLVVMSVMQVGAQPAPSPMLTPVSTAFTYQGYLEDSGGPANGSYTLRFGLYEVPTGGSMMTIPQTIAAVPVVEGRFTVTLDFGGVFDGTAYWLEIEVQGLGDPGYTTLIPRQPLTPVPYAINADKLDGLESSAFASFIHNHLGETWDTVVHADGLNVGTYTAPGRGIVGRALSTTGEAYGVEGISESSDGRGVSGINHSSSGNAYGIYGEAQSVSGAGVYGVNNASPGPLAFGVLGISNADDGQGVHGQGRIGVSGWSFVSPGAGVTGANYSATGATTGVAGYSHSNAGTGVRGEATASSGTNYGVTGTTNSIDGYDFYAGGAGTNYGPFTGAHEVRLAASFPLDVKAGMIVSATGEAQARHGADGGVGISSTLPTVRLADTAEDKSVFGALVSEVTLPEDHWYVAGEDERFASVNALGEGRVWVSSINGGIEAGDYITTSALPGYGQRQNDDLLHNYTLGKATESVDWDSVTETVDYNGETYKVYLLAVVYTSG